MTATTQQPREIEVAEKLYTAFAERAEEEDGHPVYRGSVSQVFRSLRVSFTYYTQALQLLEDSGAIAFIQKGGRSRESIVVLLQKPTTDSLTAVLTQAVEAARLSESALEQRVSAIEGRLGNIDIVKLALDVERRLSLLEAELNGKK